MQTQPIGVKCPRCDDDIECTVEVKLLTGNRMELRLVDLADRFAEHYLAAGHATPTGAEIAANIRDALHAIHNPPLPAAVCECGSITAIENHGLAFPGQRNGIYCHRGHRLPGQDMPGSLT